MSREGWVYSIQVSTLMSKEPSITSSLQLGAGLQFFLNDSFALTGGYRFRHMSNAGITDDNSGINHHFILVGLSYFFE